ncbi:LLM class flavin-dependent oxidoreductase [Protofrankia symbiont of Coriaria ruscifolia]|uniref:Putative monooxygenase YxeK n=1 Tax=Candidatus Protofrankia californiensis TaxID=1839754 RepID=A0A1C3NYZ6_9ACTN|nr:LLM class flavin-dependent oxidoreductase [Protofrankia symbiont of Coriaria ruscifolia]SBW22745.1 putative monooxygenase YxeK [Candidatus Protofrankia californiensis]
MIAARRSRQLHLNAFLKPPGEFLAAWRHPNAVPDAGVNIRHLIELARTAERAHFDALFFADLVGVPFADQEVLRRVSVVNDSFEPTTLLAALSTATTRIGLIATASTTYNEPYHLARTFASLDHLSRGRAGWNLVTSLNDAEARNFGLAEHVEHEERYRRAAEFHEVVTGLWDSFDDDAFRYDQTSGIYFDDDKLHRLDHRGRYFSVTGPLNIPRSPQGRPVVVQAGSSETGRSLAAAVADVVFTQHPDAAAARAFYVDIKARAAAAGRDPDHVVVLPALSTIVGRTLTEAEDKADRLYALLDPRVALADLAYWLGGVDLSAYPLDGPLPQLPLSNQSRSAQRLIVERARARNLTIRELARGLARDDRTIVSTPEGVADHIQEWFETQAADGFNVIFPYLPETLDDFANLVIPHLQRRGLFRTSYQGRTLRENLGLPRPASRYARGRAGA